MTKDLAEELREYTAMKYAGDCKCGKCQLVPRALVERIYHTLNSTSTQPQKSLGSAFTQVAHDEGKPDLAALWQAVIDNTKGDGFWLGEILLTTIEQETGFNGSAHSRPDRNTTTAAGGSGDEAR